MNKRHAFTLIEMLVVIAIIGIIAALVVSMNSAAQTKKRQTQVEGGKQKLLLLIDNYQSKLNFYPPDNGSLVSNGLANYAANYEGWAATNPLVYELTGATNLTNGYLQLFDGTSNITPAVYNDVFGRMSVNNANQDVAPQLFYLPQPKEYTHYVATQTASLVGLIVPVPGPVAVNYWHYDASSTNRHNMASYDLWAEYISASKNGTNIITTNGNW
jgi:prepilin-type N-terminal cleavage/methylation domain-containing protein